MLVDADFSVMGIIPACAGSTNLVASANMVRGDHPRMRGEHPFHHVLPTVYKGSSPHARGARPSADPRLPRRGIIPACAGSTCGQYRHHGAARDHPRMRGEHAMPRSFASNLRGSSPHARGALQPDGSGRCARGIIPACAGSTLLERAGRGAVRDHPRMRGEHNFSVPRRGC